MNTRTVILFSLLIGSSLMSCKKEGCTDADAVNFDEDAKRDNASCTYKSEFVVWFNQESANNMIDDEVTELRFYLGGKDFGTLTPAQYSTSIPQCDGATGLSTEVDLGSSKKTYGLEFQYTDNSGNVLGSGSYPGIEANTCREYQITYY